MKINLEGDMMIASVKGNVPVRKGDLICATRVIPLVISKEKMERAKSKENKERLKKEYMSMLTQNGSVRVFAFMKSAHCNYYTAVRIINEMSENTSKMGVS